MLKISQRSRLLTEQQKKHWILRQGSLVPVLLSWWYPHSPVESWGFAKSATVSLEIINFAFSKSWISDCPVVACCSGMNLLNVSSQKYSKAQLEGTLRARISPSSSPYLPSTFLRGTKEEQLMHKWRRTHESGMLRREKGADYPAPSLGWDGGIK